MALQTIEHALGTLPGPSAERRAWLEAARANAQRMVGVPKRDLPQAMAAASVLPAEHPARLQLRILGLYGSALGPEAHQAIETIRLELAQLAPEEPSTLCLKIRLASVMTEHDKLNGETFELAAEVYRLASSETLAWMRAEAASILGQVTLRTDTQYARALSAEALRYFEAHGMHDMVANELYMDATALSNLMDTASLQQAEAQFRRSEEAGDRAQNSFAATYARSGLCEVLTFQHRIPEALESCAASLQRLSGTHHFAEYTTLVNYASALVAADRPRQAMELLEPMASEWSDWHVGYLGYRFYDARGRTLAALGKPREAIADLTLALRELRGFMTSTRARSNRLVQARYRVEQLQENLERKEREATAREARNRLLIGVGVLVLTLLSVTVIVLVRHQRLYRLMAFTDPLTGAANRRYTEVRANELLLHARARREPLGLAILDLDHFKSCNDRYGHEAGDEALQRFVSTARRVLRPGDLLGRWGGEEFLLLLPSSDRQATEAVIDRLRQAAAAERLAGAPDYPLCFSAGAIEVGPAPDPFAALLALADRALYRAKASGRNRTSFDAG